jgi:GH24 family phage-related lysozyme (muramidase)
MSGSSSVGQSNNTNTAWSNQIPPLINEFDKLRGVNSGASPQTQTSQGTDGLSTLPESPTIASFKVSIPPSALSSAQVTLPAPSSSSTSSVSAATSTGTASADLGQLLQGSSFAGAKPPTSNSFSSKAKEMTPFISENALQLIKIFEGFEGKAYTGAGAGDRTIGFGSSELSGKPEVLAALGKGSISVEEAEDLMLKEIQGLRPVVEKHFGSQLNPNQFGVLTSLAYNGGEQALIDLKSKSGGNLQKVGEILPNFYVTSDGQYLEGLTNRRKIEQKLWNSPANA